MARYRRLPKRDADVAAAIEEADTIEALAGYGLRAYAPATWCEFKPESGWPEFDAAAVCAEHPDHPAVVDYLKNVAVAEEMRGEAQSCA